MKKTEMIDQEKGKKSRKLIFAIALLGIALALLTIIGLIKFGTVLFFVPFWFWTVGKIVELTGANLWLARGFAALFVLPFFYLIKLMFSWKVGRRRVGWILFSLLTASLCFTMFFLSEDIYFSFKTGQAQKWYIVTPEGEYKFSDSPGYNTFWGIQYQQVTPEIIRKYVDEQERGGKATKTTGNKEIIPAVPKENIPEKKVEQTAPEKVIAPQQTTPKEIIPKKTSKEIIPEEKKVAAKPAGVGEIVPKETISKEDITAFGGSGWDSFKAVPEEITSKEAISAKTTEETISKETTNKYEGHLSNDMATARRVQIVETLEPETLGVFSEEEELEIRREKDWIIPEGGIVFSATFKGKESIAIKLPEGNYRVTWYKGNSQVRRHIIKVTPKRKDKVYVVEEDGKMQPFYFFSYCNR